MYFISTDVFDSERIIVAMENAVSFVLSSLSVSETVFTVIAACNQQCHQFPRRVHPVRKSFSSNYALADNNVRTVSGRAITSQPTPLFFLRVLRPRREDSPANPGD